MASDIKDRKVFALRNFRGLDKENAPLKVASFRASDGSNFIIDSETLKTRPAFKKFVDIPLFFETGDFLIDWYEYGDVKIYITKKHFYFVNGNNVAFNEMTTNVDSNNQSIMIKSFMVTLNFEGKMPLFQEEKSCLFIFCLGSIYVFSTIRYGNGSIYRYVLYELNKKPINPFTLDSEINYSEQFENLPIPYEPTLNIGDNAFEDVNLLSNVVKYKLFATQKEKSSDGYSRYSLATHYKKTKHISFTDEVAFFNHKFDGFNMLPVFLGRIDEDVSENLETTNTYGTLLNSTTPIEVKETFYPVKSFEYYGVPTDATPTVISEFLGLDKKTFFNYHIASTEQTVFEYLMNHILLNGISNSPYTENKIFKFTLNTEYTAIFKDATTDFIVGSVKKRKQFAVYIQLKKYEVNELSLKNEIVDFNSLIGSTDTTVNNYPSFPNLAEQVDHDLYISTEPIQIAGNNVASEFLSIVRSNIDANRGDYAEGDLIKISNKLFRPRTISYQQSLTLDDQREWQQSGENVLPINAGFTISATGGGSGGAVVVVNINNTNVATLNINGSETKQQTYLFSSLGINPFNISSAKVNSYSQDGDCVAVVTFIGNVSINTNSASAPEVVLTSTQIATIKLACYPTYPTPYNPNNYQVIDVCDLNFISVSGQYFDFSNTYFLQNVRDYIVARFSSLTANGGNAIAKIKVQTSWFNGDEFLNKRISVIVPFTFQKAVTVTVHDKYSASMTCEYSLLQELITDNLYTITHNENDGAFIFKVKDYFFDYNDEPSIDVKIIFEKNPDFDIIAQSNFGVTFGSENRLFLAGNATYPNIDRFNVSNDLLGDNVQNQSYETTYFPSKNYRVLGGKGAINGYVVATDNQLYVTKAEYPNDSKLFIRQRTMDNNGIVGYNEYKTSVNKTPLNNRCIVRFYNDILILAKEGLFGIEISENIRTDEKLLKNRDGFIRKTLTDAIASVNSAEVFVVENNMYMYIFVGKNIFIADSRYVQKNETGIIDNLSYEIIQWIVPLQYNGGKSENEDLLVFEKTQPIIYNLDVVGHDDVITKHANVISVIDLESENAFVLPESFDFVLESPSDYSLMLYEGYKLVAVKGTDYHVTDNVLYVDVANAFRNVTDGTKIFMKNTSTGMFTSFTVSGFETADRLQFAIPSDIGSDALLYADIKGTPLYITQIIHFATYVVFRVSPYKPTEVEVITKTLLESDGEYLIRVVASLKDHDNYYFETVDSMRDCLINAESLIEMRWLSAVLDFGNNMQEKTMFRVNIYATKQEETNTLKFGYKTMRRIRRIEDNTSVILAKQIDLSNNFDFNELDFNTFSISTFNEAGMSFPIKENNFLYMQLIIAGSGQIEINSIQILYKLNRLLKSIG